MADACIRAYLKATSEAGLEAESGQKGLRRIFQQGTLALQDAMETQVRSELERLKECLVKIK
jgi:hypothetical protein